MTADLDAIRERATAATPGPWRAGVDHVEADEAYPYSIVEGGTNGGDVEFIAHARTDIPMLLDEVARLSESLGFETAAGSTARAATEAGLTEIARLDSVLEAISDLCDEAAKNDSYGYSSLQRSDVRRLIEGITS